MDEQYIRRHAIVSARGKKRRQQKLRRRGIAVVLLVAFMGFTCHAFASMLLVTDKNDVGRRALATGKEVIAMSGDNVRLALGSSADVDKSSGSAASAGIPDSSGWKLVLVNPWNKLPDNFSIETTTLKNGQSIDKRAYPDLQDMMDAAHASGLSPVICSSFRTSEKQQRLFNNQVNKYIAKGYSQADAEKEAGKWVAVPGTSEHQLGLAVDIVAQSYQMLDEKQACTAEQVWLMQNSWQYGFILRYPSSKSEITGIGYEPWHYRYVGKDAAKEIYERGICLEEYLNP